MSGLLLVLAFAFMSPGLPPLRVAAPMEYILPLHPWQRYYPGLTSPFIGGDLLYFLLPWRHWAQDEFLAGRFPLWSSGPVGGMPLFASMQPAVLYPLHLLWVLMPVGAGLGVIMALKLWLAGLGMWRFLRALNLHAVACALSALSYMFSLSIVNWLPWQISGVMLITPWLLWAVYLWWEKGSRWALVAISLLVGCAILGGHPETLSLVGLTTAGWAAGLVLASRGSWRQRLGRILGAMLAVAFGFAIGMVQLLPFLDVVGMSNQFALRSSMSLEARATTHLQSWFMLDWIVPRSQGYLPDLVVGRSFGFTESSAYVGIICIVGIGLALVAALRRSLKPSLVLPWLAIGVFALIVAYDGTPLGTQIRSLPVFAESLNVRWVTIAGFALVMLGAFGWDWLARTLSSHRDSGPGPSSKLAVLQAWLLIGLGCVVMVAHALGIFPYPVMEPLGGWFQANDSYRWYWVVWAAGLLLAAVGLVFLWATWWRGNRVVPALLGLLLLVDLWSVGMPINGTSPTDEYYPVTEFHRQVKAAVPETERILIEGDVMPANTGLVYNIRDWRTSDPVMTRRAYRATRVLAPKTFETITDEYNVYLREPRYELAPLLGMRYFITPWDQNPNTYDLPNRADFTRLARKDGLALWRAEGVPGFTYLSDNVQAAPDEEQALNWLKGATWDTARSYSAVAETGTGKLAGIQHVAGTSPGNVEVLEYTSGHIRLKVNADRQALLVVSESWYPGWRATLDGQASEIFRTNYLSQGVVVSQGSHVVEMNYQSDALNLGAVLSLLGLVGTAGLVAWAWRSRQPQPRKIAIAPNS
ncbi:MAG: hypothetical protein QOH93_992 [Chloroflexia bacterium]|jgi:hypothetical protein|nr:hypothetical protein [Chloroflexia bacterium]